MSGLRVLSPELEDLVPFFGFQSVLSVQLGQLVVPTDAVERALYLAQALASILDSLTSKVGLGPCDYLMLVELQNTPYSFGRLQTKVAFGIGVRLDGRRSPIQGYGLYFL